VRRRVRSFTALRQAVTAAALVLAALFTGGCIPIAVEDEIAFRPDGSGRAKVVLSVSREAQSLPGASREGITRDIQRALPEGAQLRTREDEKWWYWDITFSFSTPQQLREALERAYGGVVKIDNLDFVVEAQPRQGLGLFERTTFRYSAQLSTEFRGDAEILSPYFRGWTHRAVLPGRLKETNGKVEGKRIVWKLGADETVFATAVTTVTQISPAAVTGILAGVAVLLAGLAVWAVRRRGAAQGLRCAQCGAVIGEDFRFCDSCGAAVAPMARQPARVSRWRWTVLAVLAVLAGLAGVGALAWFGGVLRFTEGRVAFAPSLKPSTWVKTYGEEGWDFASSIHPTPDGGYVVAGGTSSFGAGEGDMWVLKLDAQGDAAGCAGAGIVRSSASILVSQSAAHVQEATDDFLIGRVPRAFGGDSHAEVNVSTAVVQTQCGGASASRRRPRAQ